MAESIKSAGIEVPTPRTIEASLVGIVEALAAALVASEILLLSMAVVARYVFHDPITWVDEINSFTLLWLGMMGVAIASYRGQHLRLSGVVRKLSKTAADHVALLALGVEIFLLCLLLAPAYEYCRDQHVVTSAMLEWPLSIKTAAIFAALSMVIATDVLRALRAAKRARELGAALGVIAFVIGAFWLISPALIAIGNYNLLVFFGTVLAGSMLIGVPIAFSFAIATAGYVMLTTSIPLSIVIERLDSGMSNPLLLSIPMFIFLGLMIGMTGLADAMVTFLAALVGRVRGGLAYVLIMAMYLVSGISGAKAADMAAVGPALFPEMKRRGSDPRKLVSLLAASAVMSETIPPSIVLIMVGSITSVSIAALFAGGIMPALVAAAALALTGSSRRCDRRTGG